MRKSRVVIAGLLAALAMGFGVSSASAAPGVCSSGYSCVWYYSHYNTLVGSGAESAVSLNSGNFPAAIANKSNSAWANGGSCNYTEFWTQYLQAGSKFTLYSQTRLGSNYRDPQLSNGAGFDGAGINFANDIASYRFTGCA